MTITLPEDVNNNADGWISKEAICCRLTRLVQHKEIGGSSPDPSNHHTYARAISCLYQYNWRPCYHIQILVQAYVQVYLRRGFANQVQTLQVWASNCSGLSWMEEDPAIDHLQEMVHDRALTLASMVREGEESASNLSTSSHRHPLLRKICQW